MVCSPAMSAEQFKNPPENTHRCEELHVLWLERLLLQLLNWNCTRGITLEKNLTSVHTATRDSVGQHQWNNMRGSTLERNRITAFHVARVSLIPLLYSIIQKTNVWNHEIMSEFIFRSSSFKCNTASSSNMTDMLSNNTPYKSGQNQTWTAQ